MAKDAKAPITRPTTMRLETLAVHAGVTPDPTTGAVTPPIHLATTFERAADGSFPGGYVYTRGGNPTRTALEQALAALQGGSDAAAFASGSAAASAVFRALRPGDHAIVPRDLYHGIRHLLHDVLGPWGLAFTTVDPTDPANVAAAAREDTRLIWVETPSNPTLGITDIAAVADIARSAGSTLVVDATWTPPGVQDPFALGADLVVHSTTKYLGGHSDVLGGAVITRSGHPMFERVRALQTTEGAVPDPFACWLVMRGLRTLPYRMRGHTENAAKVAAFLDGHTAVAQVLYPGLPQHPGHAVAAKQMTSYGGMVSFRVNGGEAAAMSVAARVRLFTRATSLGGVESLIEHRASIEGEGTTTPDDLLRVSVGLEHPDDLIDDLRQALEGRAA
ncbi:MAG: PLP-dependent transferase [Trueperaceae bacterium]